VTTVADQVWTDLYDQHPQLDACAESIASAWRLLVEVLRADHRVLVCGNGGSAADSEHIAGELAKSCALPRPLRADEQQALVDAGDDGYLAQGLQAGFAVIPLVSQAALMTAIGNDQGADLVFAQQVVAYGRPGDLLWALSTSGRSKNIVLALRAARARRMHTLAMTGPDGGDLSGLADVLVTAPGRSTPQIQQSHLPIYHALCLAVEAEWFAA
jgi:D-sedoheptulose 7-phosphate isomerase